MLEPNKFRSMLISLFESKLKLWTDMTIEVWYNELKEIPEEKLNIAFKKLIRSEDDFISVGKILALIGEDTKNINSIYAEKAWQECLASAKCGGNKIISARAGKALNSFGGMIWLRNSNLTKIDQVRKQFMKVYEMTPEPKENNFVCYGQLEQMYLVKGDQKLLE